MNCRRWEVAFIRLSFLWYFLLLLICWLSGPQWQRTGHCAQIHSVWQGLLQKIYELVLSCLCIPDILDYLLCRSAVMLLVEFVILEILSWADMFEWELPPFWSSHLQWMTATEPYRISYRFPYEPYILGFDLVFVIIFLNSIAAPRTIPRFDVRFFGYGNDKARWSMTLTSIYFIEFKHMPAGLFLLHSAKSWLLSPIVLLKASDDVFLTLSFLSSHNYELNAAGYEFWGFPKHFVVHIRHSQVNKCQNGISSWNAMKGIVDSSNFPRPTGAVRTLKTRSFLKKMMFDDSSDRLSRTLTTFLHDCDRRKLSVPVSRS